MGYLVRKFNRAKWCEEGFTLSMPVSADAVTTCLRTKGNTLSFWVIDSMDSLADGILAIASGFNQFDTMDVVIIPEGVFEAAGLELERTQGGSKCEDLNNKHWDMVRLDVVKLSSVAQVIACAVMEGNWQRFERAAVIHLVRSAVQQGRIVEKSLPKNMVQEINKT